RSGGGPRARRCADRGAAARALSPVAQRARRSPRQARALRRGPSRVRARGVARTQPPRAPAAPGARRRVRAEFRGAATVNAVDSELSRPGERGGLQQEERHMTALSTVAKSSSWAPRLQSVLRIVAAFMFMQAGTMKLFAFPAGVPPNGGT